MVGFGRCGLVQGQGDASRGHQEAGSCISHGLVFRQGVWRFGDAALWGPRWRKASCGPGARTVELVDNKTVAPGLLVRQGFEDADIGRSKAHALADRLRRIDPDLEAAASTGDLIQRVTGADPLPMVDLLVDCTASVAVRTALEHALRDAPDTRPPIASVAIDSQAANGIATLSRGNHSGGTLDLTRRLKLEACRTAQFAKPLEAFWPRSAPGEEFQPEPGCSEPTFIGSQCRSGGTISSDAEFDRSCDPKDR